MIENKIRQLEEQGYQIHKFSDYHYRIRMFGSPLVVDLWVNKKMRIKYSVCGGEIITRYNKNLLEIINLIFK